MKTSDAGGSPRPAIVVIGNPENRRARMFCEAARRLDLPEPRVLAYVDLLDGGLDLHREIPPGCLVRLESPGENAAVERALTALGARHAPLGEIPDDYRPEEAAEHGRIDWPRLWYRGFCQLLEGWQEQLAPLSVAWMNHPADIRLAFDKSACHALLDRSGIPVPPRLGTAETYDALRTRMRETGRRRVFVKLNHGSSASGVVALDAGGPRLSAITSVEVVKEGGRVRLYNSLAMRRYEREADVAELVDALGVHGVHLEAWIPKATLSGHAFDLRVMVVAGEVRHLVVRMSRGPITNLHLGNRRGDRDELLQKLPACRREAAWETCRRVAALFPRSLYLGIDLLFTPGFRRHAVLEINAFGDLLPGVLDRGQDTYTAELAAVQAMRRPVTARFVFPD